MKTLITSLAICLPFLLSAQQVATWTGGTPGKNTDWNEPRNWDIGQIPGPDTKVIIARSDNGHYAQPIISSPVQIAEIVLQSGATLTISATGQLTVDGTHTYSRGIVMQGGTLTNEGEIMFKNIDEGIMARMEAVQLQQTTAYYSALYDFTFEVASSFPLIPAVEKKVICNSTTGYCSSQ
jgi:hypothetical protein